MRRLVHLGALGVADREDLHYAKMQGRAETAVRASGLDWTILKPSLLFGPRDGFFNIVADLVRCRRAIVPVPGNGKSRFQPIHVADLALCARLALERPETIGADVRARRAALLDLPRDHRGGRSAGWASGAPSCPMPRAAHPPRGRHRWRPLHLRFFPVATDQLRQLALDNIGPLDGVYRAFGFVPRTMEGGLLTCAGRSRTRSRPPPREAGREGR